MLRLSALRALGLLRVMIPLFCCTRNKTSALSLENNPIKLEPIEFLLKNVTIHCLFELGHVESITEILKFMLQKNLQVDQALLDCYLDRVLQTISAIFNRREEQSCKILLSCMVTYYFWPPRKKDKHKMQKKFA